MGQPPLRQLGQTSAATAEDMYAEPNSDVRAGAPIAEMFERKKQAEAARARRAARKTRGGDPEQRRRRVAERKQQAAETRRRQKALHALSARTRQRAGADGKRKADREQRAEQHRLNARRLFRLEKEQELRDQTARERLFRGLEALSLIHI